MKIKRMLFIGSLIVLFGICFVIMNKQYDELARYPYADQLSDEEEKLILNYLSTDDINYMISQQIKPEQFLPFIETKGFNIHNTLWYGRALELQAGSNEEIIAFVNEFRGRLEYSSLEGILTSYSYQTLRTFYEEENNYVKNAKLVNDPAGMYTLLNDEQETLYTYVPQDLVSIEDIPYVSLVENKDNIQIKQEVVKPLQNLCTALSDVNDKTCGNLILTMGYVSYEEQISLYEKMMLKYGSEKFKDYWDYPGKNEAQLGYTVRFQFAGKEENVLDEFTLAEKHKNTEGKDDVVAATLLEEDALMKWVSENAHLYGFVLRYPLDKQQNTGKLYQPFTLRYVGDEIAKQVFESKKTLEEYTFNVESEGK